MTVKDKVVTGKTISKTTLEFAYNPVLVGSRTKRYNCLAKHAKDTFIFWEDKEIF